MWNLNLQLRCVVIQKWRQQRPRICSVRSLCVASVDLALIFVMPGLYSTVMRLSLACFYCFCFLFFCLSRRCPLLATFLSVLFCLLSLVISERFPGLISFGSVYLLTTAGFDELYQFLFFSILWLTTTVIRNSYSIFCLCLSFRVWSDGFYFRFGLFLP